MRLLLLSLLLAKLLICTAFVVSKPSGRVVDCDDPEAHDAARASVAYVNTKHNHGYKYTLNRVEKVKVLPETDLGETFFLELDLLETKCPAVSPTSVENCPVRPIIEQAVEADCDVKLHKKNGSFSVVGMRCKSEPDSAENVFDLCPNCSLLAPMNDSRVVHAADVSLLEFNNGNNTVFYKLHEIGRAQIQAPPSNKVNVEFVIVASNCSKEDASSALESCDVLTGNATHFGACIGSVVKHQGAVDEEVTVQCTIYDPQPGQADQTGVQNDALVPQQQPAVAHGHFHHNLHYSSLGPHSSESNSAEGHLLAAHASHPVKRSLTGEPVPPSVSRRPLCPGKKVFF
ncbi:alpha-2-HS-glycoprotein-like [Rhinophrynus dorsalis]